MTSTSQARRRGENLRLWPPVVLAAVTLMALLQWVLHHYFMRLPMLHYHIISAVTTGVIVAAALVLYLASWRANLQAAEALRRLQASEALRDDLTAMLVHDFKSPLTSSLLASKMLLKRSRALPEWERDLLGVAVHSQMRLVSMIEDMLDVARAEEGKLPVDLQPTRLQELAEQAVEEALLPARQAQVELTTEAQECPEALADREKVRRVLSNLLGNAVRLTPPGGTIAVGVRCAGGEALVSVRDTGPGLPAGEEERIFDKFAQSGNRQRLSVGLGLTFCRLAVEAQGGRIWAENNATVGSTFSFTLPLAREGEGEASPVADGREG